MNSPFYESEQRRLYPHRDMMIFTKEEAASYFKRLIERGIETEKNLSKTPLGEIKSKYAVNCDCFLIYDALNLIDKI